VTEFVENGSLADHLPDSDKGDLLRLNSPTKIFRIIVGIVLAMRYLYSQNVIHRNLTPDNILLDRNWSVRVCDFGESVSPDHPQRPPSEGPAGGASFPEVSSRYASPEIYENIARPESDVFSFGMILYELIIGRSAFPKCMTVSQMALALVIEKWCPTIPDNVTPATADLIRDCLAIDYCARPSFIEILHRLKAIGFKLMPDVNSKKISEFVKTIEDNESF
jgi:serine/threonine protein kinase